MKHTIKLNDCDCGGIPQVTFVTKRTLKYRVICASCSNQTTVCGSLREAAAVWNQFYCCALPPYEAKPLKVRQKTGKRGFWSHTPVMEY